MATDSTSRRMGTVLALALMVGTAAWWSAPATASDDDGPEPAADGDPVEPMWANPHQRVLHGPRASDALERAPRLVANAVARNLGRSLEDLLRELDDDPTFFITTQGDAGYVDVLADHHDHTDDHDPTAPAVAGLAVPPGVDVFELASRPSSPLTIYLDLDGHLLQNELWNTYYELPPTPLDPFDRNGDPTTFDAAEREEIYEIWLAVADDFAPFDVNVTTADPGTEALRRSGTSDAHYGSRLVVTGTNWLGSAGVAFIDVFSSGWDVAAFAFTDQLRTPSRVAHAASHEIGHTLGLGHDGYHTSEYYFGTATWGPIMGGSGGSAITQWSKGDYPGATRFEDDLGVIGTELPTLIDDHGATATAATPLVAPADATGRISDEHDVDVFEVSDVGAPVELTLRPAFGTTNLHARIDVTDADGGVIATLVPGARTGWVLTTVLPAGRHLVSVRAAAWGTIPDGFPTYGALGEYTITLESSSPPPSEPPTTTTPSSDPPPTTPPTAPPTTTPPNTTPPTTTPPTTTPPAVGSKVTGPAGGPIAPAVRVNVPAAAGTDSSAPATARPDS